jgi:hypothetical protein
MEARGEECAHRSTGMESQRRLGSGRTSLEGWTRAVDGEEIVLWLEGVRHVVQETGVSGLKRHS